MREPTKRQMRIVKAIRGLLRRGEVPTYKNIAEEDGCCLTYAYTAVLSLEKKGLVTREPGKHGSVNVV